MSSMNASPISAAMPERTRARPLAGLTAVLLVLAVLIVLGAGLGSSFMPPERVIAALLGQGSRADALIIWTLRLPRLCLALAAGAALALSGAILQRVARNPLASPSILGITDGAAVGVVAFLWLWSDSVNALTVPIQWKPVAAVLGAVGFALITGLMTLADPRRGPMGLILYGIAMGALAKALVTLLMIMGPVHLPGQAMMWMAGSVGAAHWSDVAALALVLLVSLPLLLAAGPVLAQMRLDGDSARASGLALGRAQIAMVALAVALTGSAVAFVGAIGFVGLIAPHGARHLVREGSPAWLAASALIGAALVLGADILARVIAPPLEIPAGAVTAVLGAPLFILLLVRGRKVRG
ncbi:MAG: iron ABC transporter permease [Paracoccus sp. (in: a-proteobacteria)]|nr:iron ABC transporter permease [Paracoccus sp. (in: a-proteobacteria)]